MNHASAISFDIRSDSASEILLNALDLTAIASLASIPMLFVNALVNVEHLRLTRETGARKPVFHRAAA